MQRYTTHHPTREQATAAMRRQERDPGYPDGATFEVEQTSYGFAVRMTQPDGPCHFHSDAVGTHAWGSTPLCEACWERTLEEAR